MSDSESIEDEVVQTGYPDRETIGEELDNVNPLVDENMEGSQLLYLDIGLPEDATLETLQKDHKHGYEWTPPAHVLDQLRHVTTLYNRSDAKDTDREGDPTKMLILAANVVHQIPGCTKKLSLDFPGMRKRYMTETGMHNWVIPAGKDGIVCPVNQSVFDPETYHTEYMFDKNNRCSMQTLNRHIRLDLDPEKRYAGMETNGVGWKNVLRNIQNGNLSDEEAKAVVKANEHLFVTDRAPVISQIAKVPYGLAEQIHSSIAETIRQQQKGFIDFTKWKALIKPANGQAWTHDAGMIRESMGLDSTSKGYERDCELARPITSGICLQIKYVLGEK